MKLLTICFLCLVGASSVLAAPVAILAVASGVDSSSDSASVSGLDSTSNFAAARIALDAHRIGVNKPAMLTLGAWAAGNMLVNGLLMLGSSKQEDKTAFYFQQMNLFWGAVNLGLAASGYWSALSEQPASNTLSQSIEKQNSIEAILLLNAGLDVAYMAGAAWMLERARSVELGGNPLGVPTLESQRWRGFGQSLLLQGAFLLAFDVVVYFLHHLGGQPLIEPMLQNLLQGASLGLSGVGGASINVMLALHLR
jgi:hypothetical protein